MEALRPQAVMTLCEVLHHCRKALPLDQLSRVVALTTSLVADASLPYASQSTCVRLTLNLVECLYAAFKRDPDMGAKRRAQQLLSRIFASFVAKLGALRLEAPPLMAAARAERAAREARLARMRDEGSAPAAADAPLYLASAPGDKEREVGDCRQVVQNVVYGMKTLVFSILYCTRMVGERRGREGGLGAQSERANEGGGHAAFCWEHKERGWPMLISKAHLKTTHNIIQRRTQHTTPPD